MSSVIVLLSLALSTVLFSPGDNHKIEICHVPPGNPANARTIEVDNNAWSQGHSVHNNHSLDYVGACRVDPTPPPEPTSPPVPTPTDTPRTPEPTSTPPLVVTWVGPGPTTVPPTVTPTDSPACTPETPTEAPAAGPVCCGSTSVVAQGAESSGPGEGYFILGAAIILGAAYNIGVLLRRKQ